MSTNYFLNSFVIIPIINNIFSIRKLNRSQKIFLSVVLLLVYSIAVYWLESSDREPNLYEILNVPSTATTSDIKNSFRQASIYLHPDKNPSPTAETDFIKVREAFELLNTPGFRSKYNHFGDLAKDKFATLSEDGYILYTFISSFQFYLFWTIMSFVYLPIFNSSDARTWCISGLLIVALIQFNYTFNPKYEILPQSILSYQSSWTPFDKGLLFQRIFPSYFSACQLLSKSLKTLRISAKDISIIQMNDSISKTLAKILQLQGTFSQMLQDQKKVIHALQKENLELHSILNKGTTLNQSTNDTIESVDTDNINISLDTQDTGEDITITSQDTSVPKDNFDELSRSTDELEKIISLSIGVGLQTNSKLAQIVEQNSAKKASPFIVIFTTFGMPYVLSLLVSGLK